MNPRYLIFRHKVSFGVRSRLTALTGGCSGKNLDNKAVVKIPVSDRRVTVPSWRGAWSFLTNRSLVEGGFLHDLVVIS